MVGFRIQQRLYEISIERQEQANEIEAIDMFDLSTLGTYAADFPGTIKWGEDDAQGGESDEDEDEDDDEDEDERQIEDVDRKKKGKGKGLSEREERERRKNEEHQRHLEYMKTPIGMPKVGSPLLLYAAPAPIKPFAVALWVGSPLLLYAAPAPLLVS
jgi:hypothetical protein